MHWGTASIQVPEKPLLTAAEVATLFEVHAKTILRWVEEKRFPEPTRLPSGQARWTNYSIGVWMAWQNIAPKGAPGTLPPDELGPEDTPPAAPKGRK